MVNIQSLPIGSKASRESIPEGVPQYQEGAPLNG
jgi:hypothetical protein